MAARIKRLNRELESIDLYTTKDCAVKPINTDLTLWECIIKTDIDSDYEGAIHRAEIAVPTNYPFMPPKVTITTKINHPCIGPCGYVSIDILGNNWSPALTIPIIGLTVSSILNDTKVDVSQKRTHRRVMKIKNELIAICHGMDL